MNDLKKCNKCEVEKTLASFSKDKSKSDGLCTICKDCVRENRRKWYLKNKDKVKEYQSKYEKDNAVAVRERARTWREKNREKLLSDRRERHKKNYSTNIEYALNHRIRSMLKRVLNATGKDKDFVTFKKIGYSSEQLIQRISCQFKKGMSWDNISEWEIDHKIPVSVFISKGEVRPNIINALSNLQPLWVFDNRSKGARYIG